MKHALPMILVLLVSGCAQKEEILLGPRFDLRQTDEAAAAIASQPAGTQQSAMLRPTRTSVPSGYAITGEARGFSAGGTTLNADWPQRGGGPNHVGGHPALGSQLTEIWSAPIGQGNGKRIRLTAEPVAAGGRVITMDSASDVRAFSTGGGLLWQRNLTPPGERRDESAGGGLAVSGNRLFVTTGYGELHSLDLASGAVIWTQELDAMPSASPTIYGDLVYLTSRDGRGWAISAADGKIVWQIEAQASGSGTLGGASPAVNDRAVIFPFGSGELVSVLRRGGVRLWGTTVSGERLGRAYGGISDISSDPVIFGSTIYAGNPGGRLAAIDATTGEFLWTAREGANSAVWPAGGSLFLISDENKLIRLDASTGEPIWSASLPLYTTTKIRKRSGVFAHFGPILAGGRLIVVSSDGYMREVNPANGQLLRATELSAPAALDPVVAGGTLYVVTADGKLHAFR